MTGEALRYQVSIVESDFDIASLQAWLLSGSAGEGAIATFTGYVRADKASANIQCMELEHYPGMTQDSIGSIVNNAAGRWPIIAARVVHRVGRLYPGEQIVWVGVSSAHRAAAFSACEYIMDYLKAEAPLWKKEYSGEGEHWVDAKESDVKRAGRWARDSSK